MFSGIVQGTGKVSKIITKKDHISIEISAPKNFNKKLKKGASISVDGVCLTSLDNGVKKLKFDIIEETLTRTNLKNLKKGSFVNLERSITASTEIGGHLMSGHIQCKGRIKKVSNKNNSKDMIITFPKKYKEYIFEKGYIGINGCSLTLGKVNKNSFYIHLIPETLSVTNLDYLKINSEVNIEIDQNTVLIVETVKNSLTAQKIR
ncbi:MAG: riboflavin synthase [Gammaproteobacteria bacterium]|mgnify:FL=1|nr:riboflavin synthase [Gammaproteobacteria bacterium]|tara:strand:+ start:460 stop:1074 length:615 start_codon:yes stop_codon:yes gene_type:complete